MSGKRGRPKLARSEQRTCVVTTLLRPKERRALKKLARLRGQSVSSVVREAVVAQLGVQDPAT
ncbi:MAG: hypothetical protein JSW71_05725 [Gemmatimonadota bacterium]|nr:MAG: hypothetical protein JSW71_05725 [Gemmatimonadota bacterium]